MDLPASQRELRRSSQCSYCEFMCFGGAVLEGVLKLGGGIILSWILSKSSLDLLVCPGLPTAALIKTISYKRIYIDI